MTAKTIFSPTIDTALVGGLSFVFFALCILLSLIGLSTVPSELVLWDSAVLTILLNGSHFIASYRILYGSNELVRRYKSASVYVPIGLILYTAFSLYIASSMGNAEFVNILLIVSSLYLALHYTGQAWGMMASFAFLNGTPFAEDEKKLLRISLRVLAFWQMGWALSILKDPPSWLPHVTNFMPILHAAAWCTIVTGGYAFYKMYRRTGILPSKQMVFPFFVVHLWYLALWYYPQALFWVQISHSVQYLSFPSRVEFNRIDRENKEKQEVTKKRALYFLQLVVASTIVFYGMPYLLEAENPLRTAYWTAIVTSINIHHYFIDGCIWHIRNPTVKKELFSHVMAK
jgi:hypothetical protein